MVVVGTLVIEDRIEDETDWSTRPMVCVIPCGSDKLDRPAMARDLYTSTMFRLAWDAAMAEIEAYEGTARIVILSALHGLIDSSTIIEPYDVKMGDSGSVTAEMITAQAAGLGIDWGADVYAFLPNSYFEVLDEGLRTLDVYAAQVYEATSGIGDQRHVCAVVRDL